MESSNDPHLLIGLGAVEVVDRLTIRWPSGTVSVLDHLSTNSNYEIVEPRAKDGKAVASLGQRRARSSRTAHN